MTDANGFKRGAAAAVRETGQLVQVLRVEADAAGQVVLRCRIPVGRRALTRAYRPAELRPALAAVPVLPPE